MTRLTFCRTHEEIHDIFEYFCETTWSDRRKGVRDPVYPLLVSTRRDIYRAVRVERRYAIAEEYYNNGQPIPTSFGAEDSTSDEDEPDLEQNPRPARRRYPVPGDFVLALNVVVLVSGNEKVFQNRRKVWFCILPGTLDQACACFAFQEWLGKDENHEQIIEVYEDFLNTTWAVIEGTIQATDVFPLMGFSQVQLQVATQLRTRALLIHHRIIWGELMKGKAKVNNKVWWRRRPRSTARFIWPTKAKTSGWSTANPHQDDDNVERSQTTGNDDGGGDDDDDDDPDEDGGGHGDETQDEEKKEEKEEEVGEFQEARPYASDEEPTSEQLAKKLSEKMKSSMEKKQEKAMERITDSNAKETT